MDKELDIPDLVRVKFKLFAPAILKLLQLDKVNEVYKSSSKTNDLQFIEDILLKLKVNYEITEDDISNIPKEGPFIVIANHPYGGIDGLILLSIILKQRPDFKVMANYLLDSIPELREKIIAVDPFENGSQRHKNISGTKAILSHLKNGMPGGIFPAGEVSAFHLNTLKVSDKVWNPIVGKIIKKANVKVVPLYFSGQNSMLFNLLGIINPNLRTAKLPSELFNKREKIVIRIGRPIDLKTINSFEDNNQMLRFLRAKTYSLGTTVDVKSFYQFKQFRIKSPQKIIDATSTDLLLRDIELMKNNNKQLFSVNKFEVYISGALDIPNVLREISRLREITFREIGEGTNYSHDIDEFDIHYKHLFMWDTEALKIAGAYRIGEGDQLFLRFKKKGFYLNKLFKFKKDFKPILKRSLEMGRSFIVKEYQKKPLTLMLLWRGINEYIKLQGGKYKYLIGPVSISNKFTHLSKDILVDHINKNHFDKKLSKLVKPRKPYKFKFNREERMILNNNINDIHVIDNLISDIEVSRNKIPVLLKKYLLQNAKIISFNIDPKFNNALDGLIVMKLEDIPQSTFELLK